MHCSKCGAEYHGNRNICPECRTDNAVKDAKDAKRGVEALNKKVNQIKIDVDQIKIQLKILNFFKKSLEFFAGIFVLIITMFLWFSQLSPLLNSANIIFLTVISFFGGFLLGWLVKIVAKIFADFIKSN